MLSEIEKNDIVIPLPIPLHPSLLLPKFPRLVSAPIRSCSALSRN
jgi:hypothetical protein